MKPENSIRNKKVELAVSSVVFLYAANIVWYFLTGVFEWGDPLGVYFHSKWHTWFDFVCGCKFDMLSENKDFA